MHSLLQEQPYGSDLDIQDAKYDCIGHIQKQLGTAFRNFKVQYRGQKLADGKTIGGVGRLTDNLIAELLWRCNSQK